MAKQVQKVEIQAKSYPDDPNFTAKMVNMGMYAYDVDEIADILDIPSDQVVAFKAEFEDVGSVVRKAYVKGQRQRMAKFDMMLFTQAQAGDLACQKELESRIKARENRTGRAGIREVLKERQEKRK